MALVTRILDLDRESAALRRRGHGVINVAAGRLVSVTLRPWPKFVSLAEARIGGELFHRFWPGDQCWIYFNQPRAFPNFLVLKYTLTAADTSWETFAQALRTLDRIAAIKRSDALLCEASNHRISTRLLRRLGWEAHCPNSRRRNFIKRFSWPRPKYDAGLLTDLQLA